MTDSKKPEQKPEIKDTDANVEKEVQAGRRPRRAVHKFSPLKAEKRPGYHRRWVNDIPGRIRMFLEAGYTFVKDPNANMSSNATGREGVVTAIVNRSIKDAQTHKAYLMEIQDKWYNEDQEAKHAKQIEQKTSYDPHFAHQRGVVPTSTEFDVYNYKNSPTNK